MITTDLCPRCGSTRVPGSPGGLCPRCLIGGVLDGSAPTTTGTNGVLDTLALTGGPMPRVLLRDTEDFNGPGPVVRPASEQMPDIAGRAGRLHLFGEIARGGMGAVLKGRDVDLGRDLAVKVLLERHGQDPCLTRRFVEEAQIAGQLQHPGIVPVYELGAFADQRPYFAMKLVKGRTLAEVMADRAKPSGDHTRLLSIFLDIAQTMAYAHARGVIHRDLKPSNVMVGSFGEVQVMDWGLAKVLPRGGVADDHSAGKEDVHDTVIATARSGSDTGSDLDLSRAGSAMGTPSYMSPEQARGENDRLDERADVFALGSILCEILTGAPAFTGRTSGETLRLAARGDMARAWKRLDGCGADADLVAMARETLAPEAVDRPRDAGSIVERLNRHFAGVRERLRAAELAHAAESARAEESKRTAEAAEARARAESRARRLTLALAASILGLVGLGGGGYAWIRYQKDQRSAQLVRSVDAAMAEAKVLQGQARLAPPEDRSPWAEALSAARRAEDLLAGSDQPALSRRVDELKGQIEADRRRAESTRKLLARLETIRGNQAERDNPRQYDLEYARAFLDFGLDLDSNEPGQAGERLAGSPATAEIAAAIDVWCETRRVALNLPSWRRLAELARAIDPNPWRNRLRDLYDRPVDQTLETLKAQAADAGALASQPAASMLLLASMLRRAGDRDGSAEILRAAWLRFPGDYWVNLELGGSSWVSSNRDTVLERPDEAMSFYTAAVAIRPGSANAFNLLGVVLDRKGHGDGAFRAFQEANRLLPDNSNFHCNLGYCWLRYRNQPDRAIAELREALRLSPKNKVAQANLANAFRAKGQLDDAIAAYRATLRLNPDDAEALSTLSTMLISSSKAADLVDVCNDLIKLRPGFAPAYHHLGIALNRLGRRPEAIAAWREAVRHDPKDRAVWYWMGVSLNVAGEFAEAVDALRHAIDLRDGWSLPEDAAPILARTEAYVRLQPRLPAVLRGEEKPKGAAETILYARMCQALQRYDASVRFFQGAFAEDSSLAESPDAGRIYAARTAVLGGCGPGKDDPPLDEAGRARLREEALAWLREELALGKRLVGGGIDQTARSRGKPQTRADALNAFQQAFDLLKRRREMAGVRDPEGLARLPEAERNDWRAFWAEVDALLAGIEAARPK